MTTLLLFLSFALTVAIGYRLARRCEPDLLAALALAPALGLLALLALVNLFCQGGLPVAVAARSALPLLMLLAWLLKPIPRVESRLPRSLCLAVAGGALAVAVFTSASQNVGPDDDAWIHTPLQADFVRGGVPPHNPFFPDVVLKGHFGRDLLVASYCCLSGADVFHSQAWLAILAQTATWLALCLTFFVAGASSVQSVLVAGLAFLSINVGPRGGLLDTYENNNSLVYCALVALLFLTFRGLTSSRRAPAVYLGLGVGVYSALYETHFGLMVLTVCTLAGLQALLGRGLPRPENATRVVIFGTLAAGLAAISGGPVTDLVKRILSSEARYRYTWAETSNNQHVELKFPKAHLFQIRMGWQDVSVARRLLRRHPLAQEIKMVIEGPTPPFVPGDGYEYICGMAVLKLHWVGTWTLPIALVWFGVRWRLLGLVYVAFGCWAYLVPGLVDFGPVFESEYLRWEFAAGFSGAVALGLMLGDVYVFARRRSPAWALAGLALALWVLTFPQFLFFLPWSAEKWNAAPPELRKLWTVPAAEWTQRHSAFNFSEGAYEAGLYLRDHGHLGELMLANFPTKNPLAFEYTFMGLCGLRCTGYDYPVPDPHSRVPKPFRVSSAAQGFWNTGDPAVLRQYDVTWVVADSISVRRAGLAAQERKCNLKRVYAKGHYSIYRVMLTPSKVAPLQEPRRVVTLDKTVEPGHLVRVQLDFMKPVEGTAILCVWPANDPQPSSRRFIHISVNGASFTAVFGAPFEKGNYLVAPARSISPSSAATFEVLPPK